MKILCICGMGLGSSLIAKMNIDDILREMGVRATVETCDVGSVNSERADIYVTTRELAANMPKEHLEKTVILTNFFKKDEIRRAMEQVVAQYKK